MKNPNTLRLSVLGAVFVVLLPTPCARAQGDAMESNRKECIVLPGVDYTHAVDDRTILFFMRGRDNEVYRNGLPLACRDLRQNSGISFPITSSRIPRLCAGDLVTVLESGQACRLGEFEVISEEQAENLMRDLSQGEVPAQSATDP